MRLKQNVLTFGSRKLYGIEFQTAGPATEKPGDRKGVFIATQLNSTELN